MHVEEGDRVTVVESFCSKQREKRIHYCFHFEMVKPSFDIFYSLKNSMNTNCLPKLKGFKIAFLNIVSLPKHLDDLRLRLQSQSLDVLALSETVYSLAVIVIEEMGVLPCTFAI